MNTVDPRPHGTVVLCTYNRCEGLALTLDGMTQLDLAGRPWELVVVDNGSDDATGEVTERFANRLPLRRVVEHERGLSAARNRGLAEAQADLVVFTDDDVDADPRVAPRLPGRSGRASPRRLVRGPLAAALSRWSAALDEG